MIRRVTTGKTRFCCMTFLIKDSGAFHGKKLRIQPLIQHELRWVHLCAINGFNRVLYLKLECTFCPGKQREYHMFNMFPHHFLN